MEQKFKHFFKQIGICAVAIFAICAAILSCGSLRAKSEKVFAVETTIDNQTQIYENGGIISQGLWNALKVFYNNNKTDDMPSIKVDGDGNVYLTILQFKNFPVSKLDLSNKEITSINNLSVFDLTSFDEIDLSNNKITSLGKELKQLNWLKKLNLQKNELSEFVFDALASECYSQNLTELNISENNIVTCNLRDIANGEIDASFNRITKQSLTLPTEANVKVNLSDNFISSPNIENSNISYGLQGAKNGESYSIGTKIEYFGIEGISEIKIYFLEKDNDSDITTETEVKTLVIGETYAFPLGYYSIKFGGARENMNIYIAPAAPTLKMFRDNQEIELNHVISSPVVIKFFGNKNATFVYRINSSEARQANEIEIKNKGINNIVVYQIVDGYLSFATTFYVEYMPPQGNGWIFALGGVVIFVLAFYFAIKYLPQITKLNIGKKDKNKTDLD